MVRRRKALPDVEALLNRGGYETTLGMWSKLAPEAGEMLADAAVEMVREVRANV